MTKQDPVDWDKVEEAALALLCLTLDGSRVWKGLDWSLMNRLHERGWILDPKNKKKSVGVTEEGEQKSEEFFQKYFVVKS